MRWLSRADEKLAELARRRGIRLGDHDVTATDVKRLDERGAFGGKTVRHPGRPVSGSEATYPAGAIDVLEKIVGVLNRHPRSFNVAVLISAGAHLQVGDKALGEAYSSTYEHLRDWLSARDRRARFRVPAEVFAKPLDSLAKGTIFNLALDEVPITYGIDSLIEFVGLPDDLRTFPPEPDVAHYPDFVEITRGVALQNLLDVISDATREEIDWATARMATLLGFAITLARLIDLTDSPFPPISDPDPVIVASAHHVLRTLTMGGRVLHRMMTWAGDGATEYMAAFCAPVLLAALRMLPARARDDVDSSLAAAAVALPRLNAMLSLVEWMAPDLRRFLSFDAAERLVAASDAERASVRSSVTAWLEAHPAEHRAILGEPPKPALPEGSGHNDG